PLLHIGRQLNHGIPLLNVLGNKDTPGRCFPVPSDAGAAEASGTACGFGEFGDLLEGGFDALDDAELGDAVAGGDGVGQGVEVGEDDLDLAAVAGVDNASKGGEALEGEAGAV